MPSAVGRPVGELVDQHQVSAARDDRLEIEIGEDAASVADDPRLYDLEITELSPGGRSGFPTAALPATCVANAGGSTVRPGPFRQFKLYNSGLSLRCQMIRDRWMVVC